ncbi:hypothetical protein BZM27_32875 [Paraburkholderia steynii]|uniref:Lipoprotein n=1 Tax=Paraburkholderia steynii TaxID=1245441 RepID=A0A4V2NGM8_9BURK|nr:hypothetical protein BZM27_32875 [Paraburkholderia steynii]
MKPVLGKVVAAALITALAAGTVACQRSGGSNGNTAGTAGMSGPAATSDSEAAGIGRPSGASQ